MSPLLSCQCHLRYHLGIVTAFTVTIFVTLQLLSLVVTLSYRSPHYHDSRQGRRRNRCYYRHIIARAAFVTLCHVITPTVTLTLRHHHVMSSLLPSHSLLHHHVTHLSRDVHFNLAKEDIGPYLLSFFCFLILFVIFLSLSP